MRVNEDLSVALIYLLAAVLYVQLGLYAWRQRPTVAVTPFAWALFSMSIWSFTYGLGIFFSSLETKLLFVKLEYIGLVSTPVFLLIFALEYTRMGHLLTTRNRVLLWIFPAVILLLAWTNEIHHLMWNRETVVESYSIHLLSINHPLFFWVNIIFSYAFIAIANLMLVMELIRRPGVRRVQANLVILGIVFSWLGHIIYLSSLNPIPNLDVRPLFFISAGLGLSWAITRFHLPDISPLENPTELNDTENGVIVLDSLERILYINPIVESLFGLPEAIMIGRPINHISDLHGGALLSFLRSEEQQAEIKIEKGGQTRIFEMEKSSVSSANEFSASIGPNRMLVFHDITQRKEAGTALSRREAIMSAIGLAAGQFLKEASWEHNIPGVLKTIGQAANVSRMYVFMNYIENGSVYISLCYEWAAPGVEPQLDNPALQHVHLRASGFKRWEEVLSKGRPLHGVVRELPESEKVLLQQQGILSLAVVPIFVENQWWGFIGFDDCTHERHWTATEMEALHTTASIFGAAETRARTEQKLLRRQEALSLLHEIVREALRADNLPSMSQTLVHRLAKLINADGCFITSWNEADRQTLPLAAYGSNSNAQLSSQPAFGQHTFTESALNSGHTLVVEDVFNSPYADREIAGPSTSRSVMVLPLIAVRKRLGAIILSFDQIHRFQPEEVSISEQAASLIALAFEKFQAMEQAKHRANVSETLRKAGVAVTESLDMSEAVTLILEQLKQVVPYDSASVQLLNGDELEIVGGSGWNDLSKVIGMRFPIPGDNPNSVVIQSGKPHLLPDAGEVYEAFRRPPHNHIRSWLGVPLIVQDKIIGLLSVDSSKPDYFTQDSLNVVLEFADQVAITLKNSRLFEETRKLTLMDPLTGLHNRRGLFELGNIEFSRSDRVGSPFSGIMIDIDHFKEINDTYGHDVGDKVLQELAKRCKKCVREIDLIGRHGGEEFVILLPETDLDASLAVGERLRSVISHSPICIGETIELNVTASIGVARKDENTPNLEILITRADQAMYIAKHKGRNRVARSL